MSSITVNHAPLTPLSFLQRNAYVFRDRTAVVYGDVRYTYSQFQGRVNRLASALRAAGVGRGDRVAVLAPNVPALLEAHFGVPLAGGVLVALNTRLNSNEIAYIINHSESKVLLVDTELTRAITPIMDELGSVTSFVNIVDVDEGEMLPGPDYETFLEGGSAAPLPMPIEDENELISINYTSGTTGLPKGVMYSHRGAYLNALGEALELGISNRSVYLWTVPMFHANGWCFTWGVTSVGGTHVC
ncbi:MAG: AMP-binding protein, partial [Dehalococcoidia bacterium]